MLVMYSKAMAQVDSRKFPPQVDMVPVGLDLVTIPTENVRCNIQSLPVSGQSSTAWHPGQSPHAYACCATAILPLSSLHLKFLSSSYFPSRNHESHHQYHCHRRCRHRRSVFRLHFAPSRSPLKCFPAIATVARSVVYHPLISSPLQTSIKLPFSNLSWTTHPQFKVSILKIVG